MIFTRKFSRLVNRNFTSLLNASLTKTTTSVLPTTYTNSLSSEDVNIDLLLASYEPEDLDTKREIRELTQESVLFDLIKNKGNSYAFLGGPLNRIAAYKNGWYKFFGINHEGFFEPYYENGALIGIKILQDGIYECEYAQRGSDEGHAYGTLAKNGDRSKLEYTTDGIFTYDSSGGTNDYSVSTYTGKLYAGDIITGGNNSGNMSWSTNPIYGYMKIKNIALL